MSSPAVSNGYHSINEGEQLDDDQRHDVLSSPPSRPPHPHRWTFPDVISTPPRSHLRPGPRVGPATSTQQRTTNLPPGSFRLSAIPTTPSDRLRWVPIVRRQPLRLELRFPDRWHGWSLGQSGPRSSRYRGIGHGIARLSDLRSVSFLHQEFFAMSVSTRYERLDEDHVVKSVMSNSLTLSLLFIILAISVTLWRTMTEELYWCVVLCNYKCIYSVFKKNCKLYFRNCDNVLQLFLPLCASLSQLICVRMFLEITCSSLYQFDNPMQLIACIAVMFDLIIHSYSTWLSFILYQHCFTHSCRISFNLDDFSYVLFYIKFSQNAHKKLVYAFLCLRFVFEQRVYNLLKLCVWICSWMVIMISMNF